MSSILSLPARALLIICHQLSPRTLVNLGQVCRLLRAVARDPRAWKRVSLSVDDCEEDFQMLRIAPALHSLTLNVDADGNDNAWFRIVDLTQGPQRVKRLEMDWDERRNLGYSSRGMINALKHYEGHLQVVKLGSLQSTEVLQCIDDLDIRDLYISNSLVKCYCGEHQVEKLEVDYDVSSEVAALLLKANKKTLTQFRLKTISYQDTEWFSSYRLDCVPRAIEQCKKIEKLSTNLWGKVAFLKKVSNLRYLTLLEIDTVKHSQLLNLFSSPLAAQLTYLKLHLESKAHRGILQAVARGCNNLKTFVFTFEYTGAVCQRCYEYVAVPRDLHAILAPLARLVHLKIACGRIPSMVFEGWENGAMPRLRKIEFDDCRATQTGLDALESLKQARPDVQFPGRIKKLRAEDVDSFGFGNMRSRSDRRCCDSPCYESSDCDEQDELESSDSSDDDSMGASGSDYSSYDPLGSMFDVWMRRDDFSSDDE